MEYYFCNCVLRSQNNDYIYTLRKLAHVIYSDFSSFKRVPTIYVLEEK